ncbi:hypothetical protein SK128_004256 [Halocaridina rubra]|uniref:UHRF1 tandem tudor domain-containing protein n=1 Tax=Halocaridina rubra TaxID=373956 RepID=A0AAN8WG16_HALRR
MENGYTLFDYNINVNDVIMLMIKPVLSDVRADNTLKKNGILKKDLEPRDKKNVENENQKSIKEVEGESEYYKVGDLVDALYVSCGTWWEAKILKITLNPVKYQEDGFLYHIAFENYEDELIPLTLKHIRPRAWKLVDLDDLKPGDMIMANYNLEDPQERGHWYDCKVKKTINTRTQKEVIATVYLDSDESPLEDCRLCFVKELFKIEKNVKFSERESDMEMGLARGSSPAISK